MFLPPTRRDNFQAKVDGILQNFGLSANWSIETEETESAHKIRAGNLMLLRDSLAVIADLNPFRGPEPDAGTVYEVGYAASFGIPICGFAQCKPYRERLGASVDADGLAVEDFGLKTNLMVAPHIVAETIGGAAGVASTLLPVRNALAKTA